MITSGDATNIFAVASGIITKNSPVTGEIATGILRYIFSYK
jgi:hypothetical protein